MYFRLREEFLKEKFLVGECLQKNVFIHFSWVCGQNKFFSYMMITEGRWASVLPSLNLFLTTNNVFATTE